MKKLKDKKKIFEVLKSNDSNNKLSVLQELEDCSDKSIIEPIIKILENEKMTAVKERIMIVLNKLIPLSNFEFVEIMLRSHDPFVRNGIVEIIKRSDIPIIDFLEKLAEDENKDVRKFVIDSLSRENSPKVRQILKKRLVDEDINIIYTAIEHLGNLRDKDCVKEIEGFLFESENFMVICSSLLALSKIEYSPGKEKIINHYIDKNDPMIVFPFLKYIEIFAGEDIFTYIEDLLEQNDGVFTKEIIDAIQGVIKNNKLTSLPETLLIKLELISKSSTNDVDRYELQKLLSKLGGDNSLLKAREMLKERNVISKLGAIEILGDTGDKTDIKRLEAIAEDTESDELLEAIGDAVENIIKRTGE